MSMTIKMLNRLLRIPSATIAGALGFVLLPLSASAQVTTTPSTEGNAVVAPDSAAPTAPAADDDDASGDDDKNEEGGASKDTANDATSNPTSTADDDTETSSDASANDDDGAIIDAEIEASVKDAVDDTAAAVVDVADATEEVLLKPEENLPEEEAKARARFEAAKKAATDVDAVAKAKELDDADKALALILDKTKKSGFWWEKSLSVGASGLGLYNQKFVGQPDGFGMQTGTIINGNLTLGYAGNEWKISVLLEESILATPTADLFAPRIAKSVDNLTLVSAYRYRWTRFPYLGPYAQLQGQTQVFQSAVSPSTDALTVRRTFRDGRVQDETVPVGKSAFLTDFLEPFTVTESAGLFIEPPTFPPWFNYQFKLGAAGQHVLVRDGFVLTDDPATTPIEVTQLAVSNSAGAEGEVNLGGSITELFLWSVLTRVYYPIFILENPEFDLIGRTHVDLQGTLSFKLTSWLSADWVTKVRRQPFVVEDWQIQSQVLATVAFNVL